jgi:hypothetical protein
MIDVGLEFDNEDMHGNSIHSYASGTIRVELYFLAAGISTSSLWLSHCAPLEGPFLAKSCLQLVFLHP